ncbi:MAG: L-seryl-tRNA(Sec) selenium transferase [Marinilabiliales bacterium]
MNELTKIPAVDRLLLHDDIQKLVIKHGHDVLVYVIRNVLQEIRENKKYKAIPDVSDIIKIIEKKTKRLVEGSLKKVFNATGVIVHTNLGRAPFSKNLLKEATKILQGYSNLEFDLDTGKRGNRNNHAADLLKFICNTEEAAVVNNNAAAVMLILKTFAENKEVIISRSELIEIGGSFRIPDIMAASGCIMREVGTTNKTKLADYENAINENTALIFKAHKSNYVIKGFTEEPDIKDLVKLGKKYKIPVVYDIGSGLLKKINDKTLKNEPDVKTSLKSGVDIVTFSGDKLIGGPQCGIITGKKKFLDVLKKHPMMRALRVCKTTIAILETSLKYYLDEKELFKNNLIFNFLNQKASYINRKALKLNEILINAGIDSVIVKSYGQYGGGSAPDHHIDSYSVKINVSGSKKEQAEFAEKMYLKLLENTPALLSVLKKGNIYFDLLTVESNDISFIGELIISSYKACIK